jgi:oligopeptide transport system permease protein
MMNTLPSKELLDKYGLSPQDLELASTEAKQSADMMRPSVSYWKDALQRFKRNKLALFMLGLLVFIILLAVLGPVISPYSYRDQSRTEVRSAPSFSHPLGTDRLGRDIFVRVMFGTRISLLVGFVTMILVGFIGIIYGGISAYAGGWCDNIMMRIVDLLMSIPTILIIIILSVAMHELFSTALSDIRFLNITSMGSGLLSIFVVLALFNWLGMARTVRGALLMNRTQEYVLASEAMGAKGKWVILKHLLPNSIGVIIISATGIVPGAIMTESFLSFIGLGVSAPVPSLGSLANDALNGVVSNPMSMVYPAVLISLIILCFNVLGDALRDALDPRMRR